MEQPRFLPDPWLGLTPFGPQAKPVSESGQFLQDRHRRYVIAQSAAPRPDLALRGKHNSDWISRPHKGGNALLEPDSRDPNTSAGVPAGFQFPKRAVLLRKNLVSPTAGRDGLPI